MTWGLVAAFWAVSILFIITPGADWAYAISAGLQGRMVVPAVSGLLLGHGMATLIVAAGVGAVLANAPGVLSTMTIAGAGYLLWLGAGLFRHPAAPGAGDAVNVRSRTQWALKGACVSGLNPKVFLLFLALLPQFTDRSAAWPVPLQILALGQIHLVSCGIVYLLVGFGARAILRTRPQAARTVSRFSGVAMVAVAVLLLAGQLVP